MALGHHDHQFPCLQCQPQDYIRMVQHLIERCLVFNMSRNDCINTLAKHASIDPVVTLTVWKELLKENQGFFQEYLQTNSSRHLSTSNQPDYCISRERV
ncbi:hypothetical protein Dsin_030884 [Dipteronia sinensis]|uniref:Angiotensin-converting enzyme 2 n=1 Tax=Dipteronia sinensis TaxID=43782 RepID=A0AAD9ZKX5_9ROSI|nr:hypothetical protein Dsin_030884 [Dipteronia sinensis]